MKRNKFIQLGSTALLAGLTLPWQKSFGLVAGRDIITYSPPASDSMLVNPGMGFETFHCFIGRYNMKPAIRFANKGNEKDKWLPLEGRKIKILN